MVFVLPSEKLVLDSPSSVAISDYWNEHIHDLAIASGPVGSIGFFDELAQYRYEKLTYLPKLVDFSSYKDKLLLEVGCGVGIDLVRFAQGGARVSGVDLAPVSIELAKANFKQRGLAAELMVMNGEEMEFDDALFDVVYVHGVLQYTAAPRRMIAEIHRVLKAKGEAILMVYNRNSWLNALSKIMKVDLEHEDAPVMNMYAISEFRELLQRFTEYQIIPERFPVETRLHSGIKARLYNDIFVKFFQLLPRKMVRPFGWHLMAFAYK